MLILFFCLCFCFFVIAVADVVVAAAVGGGGGVIVVVVGLVMSRYVCRPFSLLWPCHSLPLSLSGFLPPIQWYNSA